MTHYPRAESNLDFEHAYHQYNRVQNDDPTNEYMYQMPVDNGARERVKGDGDGDTYVTGASAPLDLQALHQRLQVLGLNAHSSESLLNPQLSGSRQPHPALGSAFKTNPISPQDVLSPPETSRSRTQPPLDLYQPFSPPSDPPQQHLPHTYQRQPSASSPSLQPPTAVDLGPSDSLSQMYRPYRGPVESVRSNRAGTNVDPVDGQADYRDEYADEHNSSWETRHPAPSDAPELEEMTMGRTEWANDTMGGDMLDMRERLINTSQTQQAHEIAAINQQIADATSLAAALTKLEVTQEHLRTLQATLIAERVARSQIERRSHEGEDDVREVKNELAGAVRALRRAKEEAKRNEEEKRRLAKCFEETKVQLYKYHEELRVRDARSKGREEGRAEAWQEAERWMGQAPPIPHIDPIQSVPQAVLRQTPMNGYNNLPQAQEQQPLQPQHTQQQQLQPYQPPPQQQQQQQQPPYPTDNSASHVQSPPQLHTGQHQPDQPDPHFQSPLTQHQQQQQQGMPNTISMLLPGVPMPPQQPQQPQTHTVYQPMIIPVPVQQQPPLQQPMQPFPAQPPHTQNIPRSAPHRLNQLPPQHPQHPQRAATVISRTPQNPYAPQLPHTDPRHGHGRSNTLTSTVRPPAPPMMPQHNAAESYLERVDHDPHVQQMLRDTNAKTVHTSAFSERPQTTARSVSAPLDKPLPTPSPNGTHQPQREHTVRQSRSGTMNSSKPKHQSQRFSMLDQLHGHPRNESNLNGEDRYPAFPHQKQQSQQAKSHTRGNSYDSVNPAGIALPHSTAGSMMNTPQTKVSRRSKVAGALRGGTEIEDLSDIAEEEREARRSYLANVSAQQQHQHAPMPGQQQQPHLHHPGINQPLVQPRQKSGYAPSMPPLRNRPVPRMPQPLGADGKAPSEPHAKHHGGLSNLFHRHTHHQDPAQAQDRQNAMFDRMPNVDHSKPKGAHDLYVPPGMAAQAVHGSVLDIQGPRTSALGLEGLDDQAQHRHGPSSGSNVGRRSRAGTMESTKAPTIMIQPPSTQNRSRPETTQPPHSAKSHSRPLDAKTPTALPSNLPPSHTVDGKGPTKRQTMVVTEYYDPPSKTPAAHAIPLPKSQPHAPTVYSGFSPDRVLSPPDMQSSGGGLPGVSVIDYALRQALPDSRPTTIVSVMPPRVATVASEPDIDEPPRFKHPAKQAKRKPTLTIYGHNTVDPRSVPLPASRAPTHRPRTSSELFACLEGGDVADCIAYAGTVATIDEVTEEESARSQARRR